MDCPDCGEPCRVSAHDKLWYCPECGWDEWDEPEASHALPWSRVLPLVVSEWEIVPYRGEG